MAKYILLTGPPGIGKTTIVQMVCDKLKQRNFAIDGFYTQELRDNSNNRIGFDIITMDNKRTKLARKIDCVQPSELTKYRVGQYVVYPDELSRLVVPIINNGKTDLLILDEIGKMELFSVEFKEAVEQIFEKATRCLLATIPVTRGRPIPMIETLKKHANVILITVNKTNRNQIPEDILRHFNLR